MAGNAKGAGYEPVAGADTADDMELEQRPPSYRSDPKEDDGAADDDADETRGFLASGSGAAAGAGRASLSGSAFVPASQLHRAGDDTPPRWLSKRTVRVVAISFVTCLAVCVGFKFVADNTGLILSLANSDGSSKDGAANDNGSKDKDGACQPTTVTVPQYFQTTPQLFAGPTATGRPAFLAQTVTIDPTATYVANQPLQTNILVDGVPNDGSGHNIFHHMGYLSPYQPAPGFGVQEYALPPGAEIVQLQMLSRHGSRYPTSGANVKALGDKLAKFKGKFKASKALSFLQDWEFHLGHEILVPKGRQELFDSGVLHSYMYGNLYNPNSKIIVRTTTQDRMLKSAENFMAGFFGLEWTNNATIEVIIEQNGFNNSLAGYLNCPNSQNDKSGYEANVIWVENYLRNATARFQTMISGTSDFDWTIQDTYAAQTMCPYETVAYGFSRFCDLFTYDEWVGFGYSTDLVFAGGSGFQSATGRAVGIGYQQEIVARLRNHTLGYSGSQINTTLDNNTDTFPLNQSLYLDFSHDSNIVSVLTALGFTQFSQFLPPSPYPGPHNFTLAHVVPFGARLDIEVIKAPKPVKADRSGYDKSATAKETKYIHFILNQRTLPLGLSFPDCDASRVDGWCELETFLQVQDTMPDRAKYDEACFGPFTAQPYGTITDGAPI
ncbi:hypothetical protein Sste5346_000900 [Sporothrix stenoceras]|uniref:3-phytase n=1 Tax=Sporothrix stenoceras TaxID=5173 RepID=A0ABR3ZQL4_9PEZI